MRIEELAVLDALNIASTIYRHAEPWWTTAEDIAQVIREDNRIREDYGEAVLSRLATTQQVGGWLGRMYRRSWPYENKPPLVERDRGHRRTLWQMSEYGVGTLGS